MRPLTRGALAVAGALAASWGLAPAPAAADVAEVHRPPVDAPVVDAFRPPAHPYGPGNRGWEYAAAPGTPVRATAGGEVLFAGAVASTLHVTVLHDDGLRTSYSYLASVGVVAGQRVGGGQPLGTSSSRLHLGVRAPDGAYLDPADVLGAPGRRPHLVAGADEGIDALRAAEQGFLADLVAATWSLATSASHHGAQRLALVAHYQRELDPRTRLARVVEGVDRWRRHRRACTPAHEPPPPPAGRRVAVLVGGLGSTSEGASVDEVGTGALGYAPGDVVRFSYAGGRVPDPTDGADFQGVLARPYGERHSQGDLRAAGAELARLLGAVAAAVPGVPVDVVAHSQGGLVARLALGHQPPPAQVATLVTLGSPHQGADLATAAGALGGAITEAQLAGLAGFEPASAAVVQLSEVSGVVSDLARAAEEDEVGGVRIVSVAARGDLVVPVPRTVIEGRAHVVVPVSGLSAHAGLPGSAEATREIALAVAGRPPTCTSLGAVVVDLVTGEAISAAVDAYGASRLLDLPGP